MLLLSVTLLLLHQGYTLAPVTTVQLGESATLTCALPNTELKRNDLRWYKQSAGETLTLIVTLLESSKPKFAPGFSDSKLEVNTGNNLSTLTIRRTIPEDEGMYHCLIEDWIRNPGWSGTYLLLKGNTQRTLDYSVQWPTLSDPAPQENSMTLQCSVLSKSKNKTCPGDISVFWFRAGSNKSHPSIIYSDGRRQEECEKLPDTQKSCVYRSSKNFSSSDAGTYYCAVATCGEILFGDVTHPQLEKTASPEVVALVIAIVCLVISVIGNIVFFCCRTSKCKGIENPTGQARYDNSSLPVHDMIEGGNDLNYAALHFSGRKATRGRNRSDLTTEEKPAYGLLVIYRLTMYFCFCRLWSRPLV
ncbi:uncharacterized protein LOC117491124 isoform X1 [Trematomus bernacchii]|uniref:uncharacterized protein LOC117491124 isoform X1 n=1 Tax=Trematomus bernacchii TaxID=40690 RepID=UPI00146B4904|nr:uncharacterized protein LOC117491124 isoform X1 [Trematomus bernacchii]